MTKVPSQEQRRINADSFLTKLVKLFPWGNIAIQTSSGNLRKLPPMLGAVSVVHYCYSVFKLVMTLPVHYSHPRDFRYLLLTSMGSVITSTAISTHEEVPRGAIKKAKLQRTESVGGYPEATLQSHYSVPS